MTNDWFAAWFNSPYYHLLYRHRDPAEADEFVQRLAPWLRTQLPTTPQPVRLLDLACGTGRHSHALARQGFATTGLDLAPDSIAQALAYRTDHTTSGPKAPPAHFVVGDMRALPFTDQAFDVVLNLFTSFGYFEDPEENQQVIREISRCLAPGGLFILDHINRLPTAARLVKAEIIHREDVVFLISRAEDLHAGRHRLLKHIFVGTPPWQFEYFREEVATFTPSELESLCSAHGLRPVARFGNYDLEAYNEQTSDRMILVFRKTN
jgi:SAM-dependent methyltransferase